jgi:RNA polymerase sigma-70 factor (ECF subfamily)
VEELELVSGLRQRSEEAVGVFLERYRSLFYHCIAHFEADHTAREDLYQDLVVYVLDRLDRDTFHPERGSFGTWLYRVAWCRSVDIKRKQAARRSLRVTPAGDRVPDQVDERPGPVQRVEESEIGGIVRDALGTLAGDDRQLLDLRFVEGATLGEISDRMSISLEQTKYRLRRATVSLRRVLLNQMAVEKSFEG